MSQTEQLTNRARLKNLMLEVLLIEPEEFTFDLKRADVETWDSLGVVVIAVGVEETFGYHFTEDEAMSLQSVRDIMTILEHKGISFDE